MKNKLLENLNQEIGSKISVRRYNLAEMISESYKLIYNSEEDTNFRKLAESHLADVKANPRDTERLSRNLGLMKEIKHLMESDQLKDEELVAEEHHDTVEPKKERVLQGIKKDIDESVVDECNTTDAKGEIVESGKLTESDEPDLTEEELEELAKHLETIRKEKKESPKKEMSEDANPRRGIKCKVAETKKEDLDESVPVGQRVVQLSIDCLVSEEFDTEELIDAFEESFPEGQGDIAIIGCQFQADMTEEYNKNGYKFRESKSVDKEEEKVDEADSPLRKYVKSILEFSAPAESFDIDTFESEMMNTPLFCNGVEYEVQHVEVKEVIDIDRSKVVESKSYSGLENFKKQSEGKAFYKTFKKLDSALKEGKALTRQESIDLYKASNSALTQLSIELEHNPDFLGTFKESVSLLSKDVNSLLESLAKGKAPSKSTMQSLAKFSESLLAEANEDEIEDEEVPVEETPEDFVGADEGDMQSEEADEFDQEYADARVDLHKELEDEHADSEDPAIQDKLDQDAQEVMNLPGTTEEQIAELSGEESEESEESEEETSIEDEEVEEDDSEITDDELAELKKHLTEMRAAKKSQE